MLCVFHLLIKKIKNVKVKLYLFFFLDLSSVLSFCLLKKQKKYQNHKIDGFFTITFTDGPKKTRGVLHLNSRVLKTPLSYCSCYGLTYRAVCSAALGVDEIQRSVKMLT